MKDAVGGSILLYIVVIFVSIVILLFVSIISYSKAYKVKNKIIEIIERNDGQITDDSGLMNSALLDEINQELNRVGYRVTSNGVSSEKCTADSSRGTCNNLNTTTYQYCICEQTSATEGGLSFEVITYVNYEFPVIGDLLTFPVKGETKILGKDYNY